MNKFFKPIFYVYIYLDPRKQGNYNYGKYNFNYEPFYIGKGSNGRCYYHLECKEKSYKTNKIKTILNENLQPIILKIKENLIDCVALKLEIELIKTIGRIDLGTGPLTNLTDGREGISGCICTEETKIKIGLGNKGKVVSEESKNKISKSHIGLKHSEESKKKISEIQKGKIISLETRKKLSESGKYRIVSLETRRKLSESNKGQKSWKKGIPCSEETKKKMSESKKGKNHRLNYKHSEETKEKMRISAKNRIIFKKTINNIK